MKVLQIMAGSADKSAEIAFADICLTLHECGEQIEGVVSSGAACVPQMSRAGMTVHELRFGGVLDFSTGARLRKIITSFQPHVVQVWMDRAAHWTPAWKAETGIPRYLLFCMQDDTCRPSHTRHCEYFLTLSADVSRTLIRRGVDPSRIRQIGGNAGSGGMEQAATACMAFYHEALLRERLAVVA